MTALAACATSEAPPPAPPPAAAAAHGSVGVDLAGIDRAVEPGDSFDRFANGGWRARTEIPADRSSIGSFLTAALLVEQRNADIIAGASRRNPAAGTDERRIADYHAAYLDRGLANVSGIRLPQRFSDRKLVFHLYIVFAERRNDLLAYCKQKGIEAKVHYPVPLYLQEGLRPYGYKRGDFPVTDRQADTMISFPAHEHLTQEQLAYIVQTVQEFYGA